MCLESYLDDIKVEINYLKGKVKVELHKIRLMESFLVEKTKMVETFSIKKHDIESKISKLKETFRKLLLEAQRLVKMLKIVKSHGNMVGLDYAYEYVMPSLSHSKFICAIAIKVDLHHVSFSKDMSVGYMSSSHSSKINSCEFHLLLHSHSKSRNYQVDQDLLVYIEDLLNHSIFFLNEALVLKD